MSGKEALPRWNLGDLYRSAAAPEIARDLRKAARLAASFSRAYEGKTAKLAAGKLARAIGEYEKLADLTGRISSYASLLYAADMLKESNARFHQDMAEKLNAIDTLTLFFALELARIPDKELRLKLKIKALAHYAPWLRDIRAFRRHQLPEALEKLLHEKDVTGRQAWTRLFDETLAALRFPYRGKSLTCTEILDLLSARKEADRKEAAESLGAVLKDNVKTFAMITNTLAKDKAIDDQWREFPRPVSARNLSNHIEDGVVDALIAAVRKSYPALSHRYYAWKARQFGAGKLDYWNRNAPLPGEAGGRITWREAVDIVLSAYHDFSPEMAKIGKQFFDKRWIDAAPAKGKDSGAFSHPAVPSAHPYILMNYQGKIRDVMTLAHELGHGIHQLLSAPRGALMADTPLTLAETASVFGEQLAFQLLVDREKHPARRRAMLAGKIEDSLNTIVRQVAFCEFERTLHDERGNGELSSRRISEIWMRTQKESLGPSIRFGADYSHYWAYIPHFIHTPFYVYAYAFGNCLVNALYARYRDGLPGFEEKYLEMLRAGGTLRHKELLKPFGLNAAAPSFWQKGLDMVGGMIGELERL